MSYLEVCCSSSRRILVVLFVLVGIGCAGQQAAETPSANSEATDRTGTSGYPLEQATDVALEAVWSTLQDLESVERIRFVLHSGRDREIYERKVAERAH